MPIKDPEKRAEYLREYYARNQDKITRRRRERYKDNIDQARAVARVQMRMQRARKAALSEAEANEIDGVDVQKHKFIRRTIRVPQTRANPDGEYVTTNLYPVAVASNFIGVTRKQLRDWIKEAKVPPPPYTTEAGRPCYTEQQCIAMRDTVLRYTNNGRKELVSQPELFEDMYRELSRLRYGVIIED